MRLDQHDNTASARDRRASPAGAALATVGLYAALSAAHATWTLLEFVPIVGVTTTLVVGAGVAIGFPLALVRLGRAVRDAFERRRGRARSEPIEPTSTPHRPQEN